MSALGPELCAALVAAQAEFGTVKKDATNPFFKSKYADLPSVVAHASPVLAKHGLAVSQHIGWNGEFDVLTTMLIHASGQYLTDTMRLHLVKDDPQGQGSAVTYARRYSYMAILGLVADEDDDGNAASRQQTVRGHQYTGKPVVTGKPIVKRSPPQVVQLDPKRQLLQACAGDKELAAKLWQDAVDKDGNYQLTDLELDLLLSRAQAEADGEPFSK